MVSNMVAMVDVFVFGVTRVDPRVQEVASVQPRFSNGRFRDEDCQCFCTGERRSREVRRGRWLYVQCVVGCDASGSLERRELRRLVPTRYRGN